MLPLQFEEPWVAKVDPRERSSFRSANGFSRWERRIGEEFVMGRSVEAVVSAAQHSECGDSLDPHRKVGWGDTFNAGRELELLDARQRRRAGNLHVCGSSRPARAC